MSSDRGTVHVGAMRVELHLPGASSLKGKRALLNKAKAALKRELECSVSEVGFQDLWQRAALGVAVASSSATGVDRVLDRVIAVIERDPRVVVTSAVSEATSLDADVVDLPDGSPRGTSW
ncbi:MAG: DUF503 domain-containing protein [Nitriliruptorales bacterium]|nr:DUF503 domain-containing protein [Nitriliruptorales bacterium]